MVNSLFSTERTVEMSDDRLCTIIGGCTQYAIHCPRDLVDVASLGVTQFRYTTHIGYLQLRQSLLRTSALEVLLTRAYKKHV